MNKAQLIEAIANDVEVPKTVAARALDAVINNVKKALAEGGEVALVGFGTFGIKKRAARVGRNPKTGEEIKIAEAIVPVFKAGKDLKEAVANAELETA